jgi:chromosomal replication initiator protein
MANPENISLSECYRVLCDCRNLLERIAPSLIEPDLRTDCLSLATRIVNIVAEATNVLPLEIMGDSRPEHIAWPRHVSMFLVREITQQSLNWIGSFFGGRDHGTVVHAIKNVQARCSYDKAAYELVSRVLKDFKRTE